MRFTRKSQARWSGWSSSELLAELGLGRQSFDGHFVRIGCGQPLVLLPGLAGGWKLVAPLARQLSRTHTVLIPDYAGDAIGGPVAAGDWTIAEEAQRLAGWLERVGLERPSLLGVSYGGAVSLQLALDRPSAIGRLVLVGANGRLDQPIACRVARSVLERFPLPGDNRFLNQFFNLLHGEAPRSPRLAEMIVRRCWETDQSLIVRRFRALETFDVRDRLSEINANTLVIACQRDVVVPPSSQKAMSRAIPDSRFELVPDAGHVGFVTQRKAMARVIRRFLRAATAEASAR